MGLQSPIDASYTNYFGLAELPFDNTPNPAFFMDDGQYKAALAKLFKGVASRKGLMVLHGDNGVGKTTLTMTLLRFLPQGTRLVHLLHPHSDSMELLNYVIDALGGKDPAFSFLSAADAIRELLLEIDQQDGRVLMIIDEAQRLHDDTLEGVRLLSNLETDQHKLIQIILAGTQELIGLLHRPQAKAFRQRISLFRAVKPLPPDRIGAYIKHRLRVAGSGRDIFDSEAIDLISRLAGGVPRMINHLADGGLTEAFLSEHKTVSRQDVEEAANDLGLFEDGAFGTIHAAVGVEGIMAAQRPTPKFELIAKAPIGEGSSSYSSAPAPGEATGAPDPDPVNDDALLNRIEPLPPEAPLAEERADRPAAAERRYDQLERISVEIEVPETGESTPAPPDQAPSRSSVAPPPAPSVAPPGLPPAPSVSSPSPPSGPPSDLRPDSLPDRPIKPSIAAPEWESPAVVRDQSVSPEPARSPAPSWESPSLVAEQPAAPEEKKAAASAPEPADRAWPDQDAPEEDGNGDLDLLRLAESIDLASFSQDNYLTMDPQLVLASGVKAVAEWKGRKESLTGEVIGFEQDRCLLMSLPALSSSKRKALVGGELAILIQADGRMYSFECLVENLIPKPKPIFFLSYPEDVTIDDLRAAPRTNCCIRAELTKGARRYSCLIVNISQGGCRIAFRRRDEKKGVDLEANDGVDLRFSFIGQEESRTVNAVVRNQASDEQMIVFGLSFAELDPETEREIIDFISRGTTETCV